MMDKKDNIVKTKSFAFAVRIVNLYKLLTDSRKEFVLSKQMLKAGTSIGANVREGLNAESTADFVHKFSIAQKECDETLYWLELMKEAQIIDEKEFESIDKDAEDLLKIIRSIILTSKKNIIHNS